MNKTYKIPAVSRKREWTYMLTALLGLAFAARAQEGTQGNTTIFAGAQATVFGNHTFATISATPGTQPGIIGTERTTSAVGTGYGVLNYSASTLTVTGANDANHVDGYVRNLGAGQFVYPVGDNGFYGPFAATGAGTTGAYFHADASTAITSNLAGGNYPALPTGAPFPITSRGNMIGGVSAIEYWDIDGTASSAITLTWDAGSNVTALTSSTLNALTIVGWNPVLAQWVRVPSTVDVTSVLGGTSILTAGSITTTANIIPNTYTIYTLGTRAPDLNPTTDFDDLNFANSEAKDFVVNIFELLDYPTTGTVSFRVSRPSGWDITVPGLTLTATDQSGIAGTSNVNGGTSNENDRWLFRQNAGFITVTLKPGNIIPASGIASVGFIATRKPGTITGTTQNISVAIIGGSGGEINLTNNISITNISAN